ncbi:MAG: dodecin family protein [Ignavibacteria bacterium]
MSILKVIEILSSSSKSWEDAAQKAVTEASKTVRGIRSVNLKNINAVVKGKKITEYRVNCKISFEVEH